MSTTIAATHERVDDIPAIIVESREMLGEIVKVR
jgi:hypothetical protein